MLRSLPLRQNAAGAAHCFVLKPHRIGLADSLTVPPSLVTSCPKPSFSDAHRDLEWLRKLRWFALLSQSLTIGLTQWLFPVPLFLPGLLACLLFDAGLTLFNRQQAPGLSPKAARVWCAVLLAIYTLTLTLMLHWAGGAHNPFTSFYLLHVALAAMMLPRGFALGLAAFSVAAYATLYGGSLEICGFGPTLIGIPTELHFQGMVVAIGLTGTSLVWFIGGLRADLRQREVELRLSRERLAREERFSGLATLAAGVAHELATPLGTIALVCRELEHTIGSTCPKANCLSDALLIRQEVDRCRSIIDRLNADSAGDLGAEAEPLALASLAALVRVEISAEIATRLQCTLAPELAELSIEVPRSPLLQALGVLLKNAAESDPSGQAVSLQIAPWREAGFAGVAFIVSDHGEGLAPAIAERVGEPFLTTKPPGQGMGLGLYIVRLFAERLRGKLEFGAPATGGCQVRLILPFTVST